MPGRPATPAACTSATSSCLARPSRKPARRVACIWALSWPALRHQGKLGGAFDGALPVHEAGGVGDGVAAEGGFEDAVGGGGIVVVVHLDPEMGCPAPLMQQGDKGVIGVVVGVLDMFFRPVEEGLGGQVGGLRGAGFVLRAAPPERAAGGVQDDGLRDIEAPAVIAGEPGHVGRVGDDQRVDAASAAIAARARARRSAYSAGEKSVAGMGSALRKRGGQGVTKRLAQAVWKPLWRRARG